MTSSSPVLYLTSILIWGTTFYAVQLQLGEVSPYASIVWRFTLAACLLLGWVYLRKLPCRFSARQHLWIAAQGTLMFSFNYICTYHAMASLTSGLVAVIFASLIVMNIITGRIFLGTPITLKAVGGATLGTLGIVMVFLPELTVITPEPAVLVAIGLTLLATFFSSLGNIISARNSADEIPVLQSNALGMLYGTLVTAAYMLFADVPFAFDYRPSYIGSLLYLSVFGSVIAFGAYLSLVGNIGASNAAYATVAFHIV